MSARPKLTDLLGSELGRLEGVDGHVLHLDDAVLGAAVVLAALLRRRVLDVGGGSWLRRQRGWLGGLDLDAHHPVDGCLGFLPGLFGLLLIRSHQALHHHRTIRDGQRRAEELGRLRLLAEWSEEGDFMAQGKLTPFLMSSIFGTRALWEEATVLSASFDCFSTAS